MNLYFLPSNPHGLKDRMFDVESDRRQTLRAPNNIYWSELKIALEKLGVTVHTFDLWSKDLAKSDDVLLVMNHPGETFFWRALYSLKNFLTRKENFMAQKRKFLLQNYRHFSKRILIQIEPWVVQPYVYNDLEKTRSSGIYTNIFIHSTGYGKPYKFFDYFFYWNRSILSPVFDNPKNKFLALLNGNVAPHALHAKIQGKLFRELYGERLRAIRYFSRFPGFDLFGWRWDQRPRHPLYLHFGKYAKKAWRGSPEDKSKTLSEYKFSICFENCEVPGWISEKIYDCFAAGCIPIYLGAPDITAYVPASCFIDFRKFADFKGVINETSYKKLHEFLNSLSDKKLQEYRDSIREFLISRTRGGKGVEDFAKELLA